MRIFLAILVAAVGIAIAVPIGTYSHTTLYNNCSDGFGKPLYGCDATRHPGWTAPVAITVAALGIGGAAAILATGRRVTPAMLDSAPTQTDA